LKPLLYVTVGILLGFPLFALSYYPMVWTSTPEFCASCHEIAPAYESWKTSSHASNARGVVADCMDCHIAAPENSFAFFYSKTFHGLKDLVLHYLGSTYDRERAREIVYATIENEQCTGCHQNLLYIAHKRGAMLAHRTVLYPREGYEKRCVDCHRNLVHEPSGIYRYDARVHRYTGSDG
jgi:cytochrome c-type protein NapC/trimethylamine-N-oxide reductase cytochrome c-type subunit TorC